MGGTKCNGMNYEEKSIQELFGGVVPDEERDVAKCKPKAGAVPCEYINFHGVTTAREFHLKVEKLYHDYLKKLCNKEWQVHFEALMKRMRGSLFCDDGGTPDHPGYTPSPPPPPYVPDYETTEPYKPTPTPYTPTPYKSKTPYTPKPYTTTRPYVPPTYAPVMKCPWKYGGNYMASFKGDCQKNEGMCNLKYFKVCGQSFFNEVYKDVCHWQDAAQFIPMVTEKLVPLGGQWENKNYKCTGYSAKSLQELFGGVVPDGDRDVAKCKPSAGIVPCKNVAFSGVDTARQFHLKVEILYAEWLKPRCNNEFAVHFEALMKRMRNSLFCADGGQPDHPGYTPSPPPPPYVPTTYKTTTYTTKTPYEPETYTTTKYKNKPTYKPTTKYTTKYTTPKKVYTTKYTTPKKVYTSKHDQYYPGDCKKGACNAKYSARCFGNLFNSLYTKFCASKVNNAKTLVLEITKNLVGLGEATEDHWGTECNFSKPSSTARSQGRDPLFDFPGEDLMPAESTDAGYDYDDYGRKRRSERAIGGSCDVSAGNFRCNGMDFHSAKTPQEFVTALKTMINAIAPKCNQAWKNSMNNKLNLLKQQINC